VIVGEEDGDLDVDLVGHVPPFYDGALAAGDWYNDGLDA
jgi:hypothetical protein